jgi:hypothetical protein
MTELTQDRLKVFEGLELKGHVNTSEDRVIQNIEHSIRLGFPQVKMQAPQNDRVCLIGGGPSLEDTLPELRELYFAGAKIVTVNGSYQWCLDRNIRPSAQIVMDARPGNGRFLHPEIPSCKYIIASQCDPDTWAQVQGRQNTWIFHAVAGDNDGIRPVLDAFYLKNWAPTPGGTTVILRAVSLLRMMGFLRFDLFGVDSCFMDGKHHAYPQPENEKDKAVPFRVHPTGHPELSRTFLCAPWHISQLQCFLQNVRINGEHYLLNVHGDGLLAFALRASADVQWSEEAATGAAVVTT